MHRYKNSTPRAAFGITAVAMSAITIGIFVVMPARTEVDGHEPSLPAASNFTAISSTSAG